MTPLYLIVISSILTLQVSLNQGGLVDLKGYVNGSVVFGWEFKGDKFPKCYKCVLGIASPASCYGVDLVQKFAVESCSMLMSNGENQLSNYFEPGLRAHLTLGEVDQLTLNRRLKEIQKSIKPFPNGTEEFIDGKAFKKDEAENIEQKKAIKKEKNNGKTINRMEIYENAGIKIKIIFTKPK